MGVRLEPKYGYCPDCGEGIHNRGAHAEACYGSLSEGGQVEGGRADTARVQAAVASRALSPSEREWSGWYQVSGLCGCPPRRDGGRCPHQNPYVPTFRVTQAPKEAR